MDKELKKLLQDALRLPLTPFPDPGAHSTEAYARAVHSAFCAIRFKVMHALEAADAIDSRQRWIPVGERPAPTTGLIDAWYEGRRFINCYWDHVCKEHRCIESRHLIRLGPVAYWRDPPAPPKQEESQPISSRDDGTAGDR